MSNGSLRVVYKSGGSEGYIEEFVRETSFMGFLERILDK